MEQIYLKIKKLIIEVSKRYNIKIVKSCIYQESDKKFFKTLKNKKISNVQKDTKINEEKEDKIIDSQQNISEKDENEKNIKLNSKKNIIQNKGIGQKPILCQVLTFSQEKIKNGKDSSEDETILDNGSSKVSIKLRQTENEDKQNKQLLISKTIELEQNNIKFTNSIIHNNSFKIICEKESFKEKEKNNANNNAIDKHNIGIQRQSFHIQSRTLTLGKDSKGSLKVNKSFKVNDSDNSKYININEEDSINSISIKNKNHFNSSFSKKEKVLYSFFINLSSTKENSLLFPSSYENINRISNNMYINNFNLQKKIKDIIMFELNNKESNKLITKKSYKNQNLHLTTNIPNILINSNKDNIKAEFIGSLIEKPKLKHCNSTKKLSSQYKTTIKNEFSSIKSEKSLSPVKNGYRFSVYALRNNSKFRVGGGDSPNKVKRKISKSKLVKVKKKLSVITRNIKSTNNAINNPNEFYMNFFNDIIRKKSIVIENEVDKDKN